MSLLRLQTLFLLSWLFVVAALDLSGQVVWNDMCPDAFSLGRTKVTLDNGRLSGAIIVDGSFTIPDIPTGSYLLSVLSHAYSFDSLRVDVVNETVHVYPYTLGTPFNPPSTVPLPYPLKLTPKERLDFYVPPQSFNLYSLLTNPMVLFGIGGLVLFAINSLVDVNALQEATKQVDEISAPPTRSIIDGQDQLRSVSSGPARRGGRKVRR